MKTKAMGLRTSSTTERTTIVVTSHPFPLRGTVGGGGTRIRTTVPMTTDAVVLVI